MRTIVLSTFFMLTSVTACTQENKNNHAINSAGTMVVQNIPFLTRHNTFIYVDKMSLKPITNQKFKNASIYTPTGFAVVENEKKEYAVINLDGNNVIDYSKSEISLDVVNGLTFYKKDIEFEKKMPVWKWDWNILGGDIKKEQTYHKIEIGILETKQILLSKEVPYLEDNFYLNPISVDENHIFWNDDLYEIKNNRLKKTESSIAEMLENKRYIKAASGNFTMYELNKNKPIHSGLIGTQSLSIQFGTETIDLQEVNKERYDPEVPKLLLDRKTQDIYPFPQYEKIFPKAIKNATTSQINFIKKVSLVYSINNSPYFLLGIFNYDQDVWAYDWLYIDTKGNVVDQLESTYNFKVLDQVGNIVWPDRKMIFPNDLNTQKWKFGKITSYAGMGDLYIIPIENQKEIRSKGLWNSRTKSWEIQPEFINISVLDIEKQIYSLQKDKDGPYTLYDNLNKKNIGSKSYQSINSDGLVSLKVDEKSLIYYYIDIYSGKEYKEQN